MSIKPIEFQLSIPKSFEASKIQQNQLKSSDINAQQNAISNNKEIIQRMQTVNDTDKTEKKDLKNDSGEKKWQENQKENDSEDELDEKEKFIFEPGKIDIKI